MKSEEKNSVILENARSAFIQDLFSRREILNKARFARFFRMTPWEQTFRLSSSLPQSRHSGKGERRRALIRNLVPSMGKRSWINALRAFSRMTPIFFTFHPSLFTSPKPSFRKGRAEASPYPESQAFMGKRSWINARCAFSRMTPIFFTFHPSLFTSPKPSFRKGRAEASPYPESRAIYGKEVPDNRLRRFPG